MLREFKNDKIVTETVNRICRIYGQVVITDHQIRNWFLKFRLGDTSLIGEPRPGHWSDLNLDSLRELVEWSPRKSTQDLTLYPS